MIYLWTGLFFTMFFSVCVNFCTKTVTPISHIRKHIELSWISEKITHEFRKTELDFTEANMFRCLFSLIQFYFLLGWRHREILLCLTYIDGIVISWSTLHRLGITLFSELPRLKKRKIRQNSHFLFFKWMQQALVLTQHVLDFI